MAEAELELSAKGWRGLGETQWMQSLHRALGDLVQRKINGE